MRTLICVVIFFLPICVGSNALAQCVADAGNDTAMCVGLWGVDSIQLGGNLSGSGGAGTLTYTWQTTYDAGFTVYHASDYLDDTTMANPWLFGAQVDTLIFLLTVSDSLGNGCTDSIRIRFSQFGYTLWDCQASILQGDTAFLQSTVGAGIPPLTFLWSPNYNISNVNVELPYVFPDSSTNYSLVVTDSIGCQANSDVCEVSVNPVSIMENQDTYDISTVSPNPVVGISKLTFRNTQGEGRIISIYNILGELIQSHTTSEMQIDLNKIDLQSGIYVYTIQGNKRTLSSGNFIVN